MIRCTPTDPGGPEASEFRRLRSWLTRLPSTLRYRVSGKDTRCIISDMAKSIVTCPLCGGTGQVPASPPEAPRDETEQQAVALVTLALDHAIRGDADAFTMAEVLADAGGRAAGLRAAPARRRGHGAVTRSTVYRVLVRNQLIEPRSRRRRRQDYVRWERPVPMELWQLDVTASAFLASGTEVKIVTGIDDHSRYFVIATAVMRATARPVCRAFVEAMAVYGVPGEVLTDNGTVFTGRFIRPRPAEVLFERICRENGIAQRLTRPRSPTTTGKIERLHQSLQAELLDVHGPFASLEVLQAALDAWRQEYNTDRSHQSLGMAPVRPGGVAAAAAGAAAAGRGQPRAA
jgi:transposase InsO family protein